MHAGSAAEISLTAFAFSSLLLALFVTITMALLRRAVPGIAAGSDGREQWVDGLRGLAALAVVLSHIPLLFSDFGGYAPGMPAATFKVALGQLGVQIFFCITGYLFSNKLVLRNDSNPVDWEGFFRNRLLRLIPAYLFACLVVGVIVLRLTWKVPGATSQLLTALPALMSFGFKSLQVNIGGIVLYDLLGVNWSLAIEWSFYFLLPLSCMMFRRFGWLFVIAVTVGAFVVSSPCIPFFTSGMLAAALTKRPASRPVKAGALFAALTALPFILSTDPALLYSPAQWGLVTALFLSLSLLRPAIFRLPALHALGTISYSLYLLHLPLLFLLDAAGKRFLPVPLSLPQLAGVMCIFLTALCLLATFSYVFVERPFLTRKRTDMRPLCTAARDQEFGGTQAKAGAG